MATFAETKILEALLEKLGALTLTPALPVAWPNRPYKPVGTAYLAATHLPGETRQAELSEAGRNWHVGLLQVSVFWPENQGPTAPMEAAGAVAAHFKRGTDLTREDVTVTISGPPWLSPPLPEPGWYQVPVNIPYWARVANP